MTPGDGKSLVDTLVDIFDQVDKYVGIVATIIAALTFASGNHLVSYAFIVIGYVLFALFLWRVASQKSLLERLVVTPRSLPAKRMYTYSRRQRAAALSALVVLTVFCFGWVGANAWHDLQPPPGPPRAKEGELLVLISQFDKRGSQNIDVAQRIYDELDKALQNAADLHVHLAVIEPVKHSAEARQIGESCNAVFVIWGWYDDVGLNPYFTIIKEAGLTLQTDLWPILANPPREYGLYITTELPAYMTYLSALAIGQLYFLDEKFAQALEALDACIDAAQKCNSPQGLAIAYSYRGDSHLWSNNIEAAIRDYDQALQRDPLWAPAYRDRGLAYAVLEQWDQAVIDFSQALELQPQDADILAYRGIGYLAVEEYQRAQQDLQEYLKLGTDEGMKNVIEKLLIFIEEQ